MNDFMKVTLMTYSMIASAAEPGVLPCEQGCNTPFGALIGQSLLTKAYSNCSGACIKNETYQIQVNGLSQPVFTGMKWQCVEYARRWLIENRGLTFADVTYAYHIWDLKHGKDVLTQMHVPMARFKNASTRHAPQVGDLLIYSRDLAITGHVAVVVGINNDSITIAEQNYFNRLWEGSDYARRLLLVKTKAGRYRISDDAVLGWVRFTTSG